MSKSGKYLFLLGLLALLLVVSFGPTAKSTEDTEVPKTLKPVLQAYDIILNEYLKPEEIDKKELVKQAISGMLKALDSKYSNIYTEEEFNKYMKLLKNRSYVGIGVEIGIVGGQPTVLEVFPDTPAAQSSIQQKDLLVRVGNKSTKEMSLEDVGKALDGTKKTKVNLKIVHPGGERELITLTRQEFDIPAVEYQLIKDKNIAVLDINDFRSATRQKLNSYLKTVQKFFIKPRQSYKHLNLNQLVKNYGSLGNAYADRENYEVAIKYYGYARELLEAEKLEDSLLLAQTYDNLGSAYHQKGNPEQALKFHNKALEVHHQVSPEKKYELASTHGNIGKVYFDRGDFEKAIQSFRRAEKILTGTPETEKALLGQIYCDLGLALKEKGKIELAIKLLKRAIKTLKQGPGRHPQTLSRIYGALASAYRKKGEIDKTMDYYKKQGMARQKNTEVDQQVNLSYYGNLHGGYGVKAGMKKDIETYKKEIMAIHGFQGFIVDLRNNPGGLVDPTIAAASMFVDKGLITEQVGPKGERKSFESLGNSNPDFPVAILINGQTTSAAEIFAAAIRDQGAGVLVGRSTQGKSVVQVYFRLSNGFKLELTALESLTPSGTKIPESGLKPDLKSSQYFRDKEIAIRWLQKQ